MVEGLERLFRELGGKVTLNAGVAEIMAEGRQVTGRAPGGWQHSPRGYHRF